MEQGGGTQRMGCALSAAGRWPFAVEKFNAARAVYQQHGAGESWVRHVDALQTLKAQ
jgi:hypothetical protein